MNVRGFAVAIMVLLAVPAFAAAPRTGQVSVGTSTPVKIGNEANRYSLVITNDSSSNPIFCSGDPAVTSSTGKKIAAGAPFTIGSCYLPDFLCTAANAIYCISTGGTATVDFFEAVK